MQYTSFREVDEGEMRYRISYRGLTVSLDEEDYQILKERFAVARGKDLNYPAYYETVRRKPCLCEKYNLDCRKCSLTQPVCVNWTLLIDPNKVVSFTYDALCWDKYNIKEVNKVFKRARGILRRAALFLENSERINFRDKVINFLIKEVK